jgi:hypothetical protein
VEVDGKLPTPTKTAHSRSRSIADDRRGHHKVLLSGYCQTGGFLVECDGYWDRVGRREAP